MWWEGLKITIVPPMDYLGHLFRWCELMQCWDRGTVGGTLDLNLIQLCPNIPTALANVGLNNFSNRCYRVNTTLALWGTRFLLLLTQCPSIEELALILCFHAAIVTQCRLAFWGPDIHL